MRRLIELRVYPDTWVLTPSFEERIVRLTYQLNEGCHGVLVAQSPSFYPVQLSNVRSFTLKPEQDVFKLAENLFPDQALAFKAIPIDFRSKTAYCRVLIEVETATESPGPSVDLSEIESAIDDINTANTQQDADIAALQAIIANQSSVISTLQSSTAAALTDLVAVNTAQSTAIATLQATVATLGTPLRAQSITLFNRLSSNYSNADLAAKNALINGIIEDDCWFDLDGIYLFPELNREDAKLNWRSTAFTLQEVQGTPQFTPNRGFKGGSGYLNTQFTPANGGTKYSLNSASFGLYRLTNTLPTDLMILCGVDQVNPPSRTTLTLTGGPLGKSATINGYNGLDIADVSNWAGLWSVIRRSSTHMAVRKDGSTNVESNANDSYNLASFPFYLLGVYYSNNYGGIRATSDEIAAFYFGAGLTNAKETKLRNRIHTYLQFKEVV